MGCCASVQPPDVQYDSRDPSAPSTFTFTYKSNQVCCCGFSPGLIVSGDVANPLGQGYAPPLLLQAVKRNAERMGGDTQKPSPELTEVVVDPAKENNPYLAVGEPIGSNMFALSPDQAERKMNDLWQEYVGPNGRMERDIQRKLIWAPGFLCFFLYLPFFLLLINVLLYTCCCCGMSCKWQKTKVMRVDAAFRRWQNDFNVELAKLGCFIKTRSHCHVTHNDKGEKQRHFTRWIELATLPETAQALKNAPHLTGDVESGCCGGVDENELCMHSAACLK